MHADYWKSAVFTDSECGMKFLLYVIIVQIALTWLADANIRTSPFYDQVTKRFLLLHLILTFPPVPYAGGNSVTF